MVVIEFPDFSPDAVGFLDVSNVVSSQKTHDCLQNVFRIRLCRVLSQVKLVNLEARRDAAAEEQSIHVRYLVVEPVYIQGQHCRERFEYFVRHFGMLRLASWSFDRASRQPVVVHVLADANQLVLDAFELGCFELLVICYGGLNQLVLHVDHLLCINNLHEIVLVHIDHLLLVHGVAAAAHAVTRDVNLDVLVDVARRIALRVDILFLATLVQTEVDQFQTILHKLRCISLLEQIVLLRVLSCVVVLEELTPEFIAGQQRHLSKPCTFRRRQMRAHLVLHTDFERLLLIKGLFENRLPKWSTKQSTYVELNDDVILWVAEHCLLGLGRLLVFVLLLAELAVLGEGVIYWLTVPHGLDDTIDVAV